jgi:hypothetical protein
MKHSRLLPTCSDPDVAAEDWDGRGALDRPAARSGLPATIYHVVIDRLTWTPLPYGTPQLIDTALARALHADACRDHAAVARTVFWDLPAYPERYAARLATSSASLYLLLAETLAGIQGMLPPGLVRSERQPADPPEVVEIWFAA